MVMIISDNFSQNDFSFIIIWLAFGFFNKILKSWLKKLSYFI